VSENNRCFIGEQNHFTDVGELSIAQSQHSRFVARGQTRALKPALDSKSARTRNDAPR
jgi:hypothetical protein